MPDEVVYPKFQSTLLQEERHVDRTWSDHFFCISIHAPTRGATKSSLKWMISVYDFNPRSYKRSDKSNYVFIKCPNPFNPRSYKRSDYIKHKFDSENSLSIHAPTRGATKILYNMHCPSWAFNPRSYKRSDGKNAQLSLYLSVIIIA